MFRHENSAECLSSLFDLFSSPMTDVSIQNSNYASYDPISSLSEKSPIVFAIPGSDKYLELESAFLKLNVSILKEDGTALDEVKFNKDNVYQSGSIVAPVSNFHGALISQARVELNGTTVTENATTHPFISYYHNLFSYSEESRKSWMKLAHFYLDNPKKIGESNWTSKNGNDGLNWRGHQINGKKSIDLIGRIHADIFSIDKALLSHVDMKITLYQNKNAFVLMSPETNANYQVKINSAKFYIKYHEVTPNLSLAHEKTLKRMNAKYHFHRTNLNYFIIPAGVSSYTRDNITMGKVTPKFMMLSFIDDESKHGSMTRNPYKATLHNLSSIRVLKGNNDCWLSPISIGDSAILAYQSLLISGERTLWEDESLPFDLEGYRDGYSYLLFRLVNSCVNHLSTVSHDNIRIELEFKTSTPKNLNLSVYMISDAHMNITSDRKVFLE